MTDDQIKQFEEDLKNLEWVDCSHWIDCWLKI
jgi:hypothetical protein